MEILLAIVVAFAVIFFGALISMGNERQRRAIDGLREQVVLWAVQDLKIKREHLARIVQVPDPLGWLNNAVSKIFGYNLKLKMIDFFDVPMSLVCTSGEGTIKFLFTPLSPAELRKFKSSNRNRLSNFAIQNPLLTLPLNVSIYEFSLLNEGFLFDLEVSLAWEGLTGRKLESINSLWMYKFND